MNGPKESLEIRSMCICGQMGSTSMCALRMSELPAGDYGRYKRGKEGTDLP